MQSHRVLNMGSVLVIAAHSHVKADNRVHGAESPTTVLSNLIWIHHMQSVVDLAGINVAMQGVNGEYSVQFLL